MANVLLMQPRGSGHLSINRCITIKSSCCYDYYCYYSNIVAACRRLRSLNEGQKQNDDQSPLRKWSNFSRRKANIFAFMFSAWRFALFWTIQMSQLTIWNISTCFVEIIAEEKSPIWWNNMKAMIPVGLCQLWWASKRKLIIHCFDGHKIFDFVQCEFTLIDE